MRSDSGRALGAEMKCDNFFWPPLFLANTMIGHLLVLLLLLLLQVANVSPYPDLDQHLEPDGRSSGWSRGYTYRSRVRLLPLSTPRRASQASSSCHLQADVLWASDQATELLVKFQISNLQLQPSFSQTAAPLSDQGDSGSVFYASFGDGRLLHFAPDPRRGTPLNLQRAIASLFQYKSETWQGEEEDVLGRCWTSYVSHTTGHVTKSKSKCHNSTQSSSSPFDSGQEWSFKADYQLQPSGKGLSVERIVATESIQDWVALMPNNGTLVEVEQELQVQDLDAAEEPLREADLRAATLSEAWNQVVAAQRLGILPDVQHRPSLDIQSAPGKIKALLSREKKHLKSNALASKAAVKTFLRLFSLLIQKEDDADTLLSILVDKKNKDILPQLVDLFGSSGRMSLHRVVQKAFKTSDQDLWERYLWSLGQATHINQEVVLDLLTMAKDSASAPLTKLSKSLILTLGTLARKSDDLHLSSSIVQWLVLTMVEECKQPDCVTTFLGGVENSASPAAVSVVNKLVSTTDKTVSLAALQCLQRIYLTHPDRVTETVPQLRRFLLSLFRNKEADSSVRALAADFLMVMPADQATYSDLLRDLDSELHSSKGLVSYVMSRLHERRLDQSALGGVLGQCVDRGLLNWNVMASPAMSTSFGGQLARLGSAGNVSFSFGMEMSGPLLKRSNFELYFQPASGSRTDLLQLAVFANGLSSFVDDSEGGDEDATAGMQISFLGNKLRPFIFFSSMGELMGLYWSGAAEQKTSALQGSNILHQSDVAKVLSNGFHSQWSVLQALSYDFSGLAKVSMWSKTSEAVIDNALAYGLESHVSIWPDVQAERTLARSVQTASTEALLKVETDVHFAGAPVKLCIRVSHPELSIQSQFGVPAEHSSTEQMQTVVPGKTLFLNWQNCELCNIMYPKSRK